MSLSTRLTRAGIALLVFGVISAVLPTNAATYALADTCKTNDSILGINVSAPNLAAGVLGAGLLASATTGVFAATAGNDRDKDNNELDTYVYHGDKSPN